MLQTTITETPIPTTASPTVQKLTDEQKQLQNYKKTFYTAATQDAFEAAIGAAQTLCDANQVNLIFNWDTSENGDKIPDGYEFLIAPSNQRIDNTTQVIGLGVGAIPSYDLLIQTDEGLAFVKASMQSIISAKFLNAIRPNKSGEIAATIPFTVADFITTNRTEGMLVAYRALSAGFIKMLKSKNFEYLIEPTFRQCLQSAAYAETAYPVPQKVWENILNKMIKISIQEGMQPGQMTEWLETRANAGMPEVKSINLEGLQDLDDLQL